MTRTSASKSAKTAELRLQERSGIYPTTQNRARVLSWLRRTKIEPQRNGDAHMAEMDRLITSAVTGAGGEAAARLAAAQFGGFYLHSERDARKQILIQIVRKYDVDREALRNQLGSEYHPSQERELRELLEPPYRKLLRRLNAVEDGLGFLLTLRSDLLDFVPEQPELAPLERELRDLLAIWFDVGFLELRRITWDSPASLLERLRAAEAVHSIRDWDDLHHRLEADRRIYGFFHPRLPLTPLIFIEVALTRELNGCVQPLLDESLPALAPEQATTAIFYSINNAERGLSSIPLGELLIKQVVAQLAEELSNLQVFSTLSPIPGLRRWLEQDGLQSLAGEDLGLVEDILKKSEPELITAEEWELMERLAVQYLLLARGRDGRAQDRVAHFHLSNGARIQRVNVIGDRSQQGWEQSFGIMVNYLYRPDELFDNHRSYSEERCIAVDRGLLQLLPDSD